MNYLRKSFKNIGIVESIGDGIVRIKGLTNVAKSLMGLFCQGTKQSVRISKKGNEN